MYCVTTFMKFSISFCLFVLAILITIFFLPQYPQVLVKSVELCVKWGKAFSITTVLGNSFLRESETPSSQMPFRRSSNPPRNSQSPSELDSGYSNTLLIITQEYQLILYLGIISPSPETTIKKNSSCVKWLSSIKKERGKNLQRVKQDSNLPPVKDYASRSIIESGSGDNASQDQSTRSHWCHKPSTRIQISYLKCCKYFIREEIATVWSNSAKSHR